MNLTNIIIKGIFLVQVVYSILLLDADNFQLTPENSIGEQSVTKGTALGVWNYTMTNADSPYKVGVIFITKQEGNYDVAIKFPNGVLSAQDIIVENEWVNFNVNIAGLERVSFVLHVTGDRITGESYSSNGSSEISGTRQLTER